MGWGGVGRGWGEGRKEQEGTLQAIGFSNPDWGLPAACMVWLLSSETGARLPGFITQLHHFVAL